ncbi:Rab-like protein 3 [Armadillidium nasatum]|uniref:Rab-like protein 3 n=1 Tax=Armadillidium nasatum TaxID=96803 RepID=A0A5N5T8H1_9CRUS|nr:Rab-like protein 3 [Armadillidium nasatum]
MANNQINHANAISKVKIVVVGDSGVGKSSFVYLASHGEPLMKSPWTIGCSIEVKLHEFSEGTPSQKTYFIEFWDVGGNNSHKNARHVFLNPVHGIVLVHDLTNRKSQQNLHRWLSEVLLREGGGPSSRTPIVDGFDAEQFGGFSQVYGLRKIPVFVAGTKLDQLSEYKSSGRLSISPIARQCGADEIFVNCLDKKSLAPGSSNAVKLSRFFDKVIERQMCSSRGEPPGYSYMERENPTFRRKQSSSVYYMPS